MTMKSFLTEIHLPRNSQISQIYPKTSSSIKFFAFVHFCDDVLSTFLTTLTNFLLHDLVFDKVNQKMKNRTGEAKLQLEVIMQCE